ncbi:MAG: transglutaminase-like domain-containing protein, partial [Odoribacter sp.]|nr:transglutaminase-like domain-containing protein [Odoribacter sp.]
MEIEKRKEVDFMKKFTKLFSLMLVVVLIISIFPAIRTEAAEKKYKLALTGEYDLNDFTKADYQYTKTLKTVKLEQVEGKNQWNLTMYAGTAVELPVSAAATVSSIDVTSKSDYLDVDYYESQGIIWIDAEDLGQKKTLTNKVITCKAYNKSKKCLSTLKIVVKILPHNAKLERKTPATAEELYELGYLKSDYSDFAWKNVIAKYPEYLIYRASIFSKLYKCPEDFDKEMQNVVYRATWEAFTQNMDEQEYYGWYVVTEEDCAQVQEILDSLNLNQFDTDWEKVLEVQKWVKRNIKYKIQSDPSVVGTLKRGNGDCDCYTNLMNTACRLLDIPCYIVIDPNYMTVGHAWNIVLVDGLWCTMDLTGDTGFGYVPESGFKSQSLDAVKQMQTVFRGEAILLSSSKYF